MHPYTPDTKRPAYRSRGSLAAVLSAGLLIGCSSLLDVQAPQLIEESTLQVASNAPVIVAGAVGDFECAWGSYTVAGAIIGDELADGQGNAATWDLDRRTNNPANGLFTTAGCTSPGGTYTPISIARYSADNAVRLLESWSDEQVPGRQLLIARATVYAGYSLVLLGEAMCSAAIDLGPELTRTQIFQLAEDRFTKAITTASALTGSSADSIRLLSLLGRARSRIDRNLYATAAADAALIPNNWTMNVRFNEKDTRVENRIYRQNGLGSGFTAAPTVRGVTFEGVADPRVPVVNTGRISNTQPLWIQTKYTALSQPAPLASWREALLIRAEAAAEAGDGPAAVGFINQLHTRVSLPPYVSTDIAAIKAQVIEERRRELFLESHRYFDISRFDLPEVPAPGSAFYAGGSFASQKCLPLPDVERLNNPNLRG
ncbi:MAG: RagB/SusD family nutrient uptake outer membrane protein [Gemmatimonadota bacterium]